MRHSACVVLTGTVHRDCKKYVMDRQQSHSAEGIMNGAPTSMQLKLLWEESVTDVRKGSDML
jgi:hypothetical protein